MRNLALAWIAAVIATLLLAAVPLLVFSAQHSPLPRPVWATAEPALVCELAHHRGDQCESPSDPASRWKVVEPWNTYSNLAYVLVGAIVLLRAQGLSGYFFGANLCLLGIFSGWYHASLSDPSQIMDVSWIYGVFGSLTLLAMKVRHKNYSGNLVIRIAADTTTTASTRLKRAGVAWDFWTVLCLVAAVHYLTAKTDDIQVPDAWNDETTKTLLQLVIGLGFAGCAVFSWWLSRFGEVTRWSNEQGPPAGVWIGSLLFCNVAGFLLKRPLDFGSDAVFVLLASVLLLQLLDLTLLHPELSSGLDFWPLFWRFGALMGTAGLAFVCRLFDGYNYDATCKATEPPRKWLCHPDSAFQAHAWWHILSAGALMFSYEVITYLQNRLPRESASGDNRDLPVCTNKFNTP